MFESLIARGAASVPNEPAVRVGLNQVRSYGEMLQTIRRATAWLTTRRIAKGHRVVIQVRDPYIFWVLAYACEALELVFIGEAASVAMTEERLTFLGAEHVVSVNPAPAGCAVKWTHVAAAWHKTINTFRAVPLPARRRSPDDAICIILSSGTTGQPKKVLLDRRMIDLRLTRTHEIFDSDTLSGQLVMLPVHSTGGIKASLLAWFTKQVVIFHQNGEPFDQLMHAGNVEMIVAAPIHLEQILAGLPADMRRPKKLTVMTGGGSLPKSLSEAIRQRLTDDIRIAYGSTEAGTVTVGKMADPRAPSDCAGKLLPLVEVGIIDPDGATVPSGQLGEVRIRGVEVIDGYLDMPGDTETYFRDGWYHPADLGRLYADGTLVIEGRIDELLNFGGRKSLPHEIEAALRRIPMITDVAALTIKIGDIQRLGIAYVAGIDVEPERFAAILTEFIDPYIVRIDHIPRNPMGKIDRPALRRDIEVPII